MTRIAKNILSASSFDIFNERLFFIVNKIYESHKFYHFVTIRIKIIIRQHDDKKNEWELKNMQSNLKEKEKMTISKIRKKKKIRDQILRNETQDYINDVDEISSFIVQVNKFMMYAFLINYLINTVTNKQKQKAKSFRQRIYADEDKFEKQNQS